jgi:hypothetical protein
MAWTPISGTMTQYSTSANLLASGYFLKMYQSGTTTAFNMATDSTGGTTLDKCQLDSSGYPTTDGTTRFIPHVDQTYKIVLYQNATDADNNTTGSADWVIDAIAQPADNTDIQATLTQIQSDIDRVGQLYVFETVSDMVASTDLVVGDWCITLGYNSIGDNGGNQYDVVAAATGTADGGSYINLSTHQAEALFPYGVHLVDQWGAVGDSVTDDTTAIQAALNYAGEISLSPGKAYLITSTINIQSNTELDGQGSTIRYSGTAGKPILVNQKTNVKIFNLTLDGQSDTWTTALNYGIGLSQSTDVWIHNCEILECLGAGIEMIDLAAESDRLWITDNYIHNIGTASHPGGVSYAYGNGIALVDCKNVVVRGNIIHDIYGVAAINSEGNLSNNIIIDGNIIFNTIFKAVGIQTFSSGPVERQVITNNILYDLNLDVTTNDARPAIRCRWGENIIVSGNIIENGNGFGILGENVVESFICDNNIVRHMEHGIQIKGAGKHVKVTNNSVVANSANTTDDCKFYIESDSSTAGSMIVTGNNIEGSQNEAFEFVNFSRLIFTGNAITNCRSAGTLGYGVKLGSANSALNFHDCVVGNNSIYDDLGTVGTRFTAMYQFTAVTNGLVYQSDVWDVDTALVRYDVTSNSGAIISNEALLSAAPTNGEHRQGWIVWNANATAGGTAGWICTAAGNPGTWKAFGTIAT